jgi:VCBS repeat-containing protein
MATNTAPTANDDILTSENPDVYLYSVYEGSILSINPSDSVLSNDTDPEDAKLSAYLVTWTNNPLFKFKANGTFVYDANYLGFDSLAEGETYIDTFTYKATDGQLLSNTATVQIEVIGVNDAPIGVDDVTTTDAGNSVIIDVLGNDTDVDNGDTTDDGALDNAYLSITDLSDIADTTGPGSGTAFDGATMTTKEGGTVELLADGTLQYTPDANFFGIDTFTYTVNDRKDGSGLSDTVTVTVQVTPVNSTPVAAADNYMVSEDNQLVVDATDDPTAPLGVLDNDSDPNNEPLGALLVSGPAKGILVDFDADGSFTYDTNGEFESLDTGEYEDVTFTYQAFDGSNLSDVAAVTIRVNGVNDEPAAVNDAGTTDEDTVFDSAVDKLTALAGAGDILANDTDVDVEDLNIAEVRVGATIITDDGADGDATAGDGTIDFVTAKGALVSLNSPPSP